MLNIAAATLEHVYPLLALGIASGIAFIVLIAIYAYMSRNPEFEAKLSKLVWGEDDWVRELENRRRRTGRN